MQRVHIDYVAPDPPAWWTLDTASTDTAMPPVTAIEQVPELSAVRFWWSVPTTD